MSEIPSKKDDNSSVDSSDFVQIDQLANYQALAANMMGKLKEEFAKMLSTQNEEQQKEMGNALDGKMEQLKAEFVKILAEQRKQMMAQFEQKMEKFREEMDGTGKQAIGNNQKELDDMWGQLMATSKIILAKAEGNVWNGINPMVTISEHGLKATNNKAYGKLVFAKEGYPISAGEHCRDDNCPYPDAIAFYFEVTITSDRVSVGFTDGSKTGLRIGHSPNSYGIAANYRNQICWLAGKEHKLALENGTIGEGAVLGCGLLLNAKNGLAVFFTFNGNLWVKPTLINPTVDRLYPTASIYGSVEANFGDNLVDKPFKFDMVM